MEEQGYITVEEYSEAIDKGLGLDPGDKYQVIQDPFLFDLVQQELIDRYGINTVRNGGLKAYTTIDPDLQERPRKRSTPATSATRKAARRPASPRSTPRPARSSPSPRPKATRPKRSSTTPGRRTASPAPRSRPSSSRRRSSRASTPTRTYYDGSSPKTLELPGGGTWTVNNSEGEGGGTMALTSATLHSVNVVFAQLDLDVGPENVTETARRNGDRRRRSNRCRRRGSAASRSASRRWKWPTPTRPSPTAASTTTRPRSAGSSSPDGKVDEPGTDAGERVLTEGQAYEVTRILEGVITSGHRRRLHLDRLHAAAGKTGTSEENSDAWFVGYTPLLLDRGLGRPPAVARIHRLRRPHRRPDLAELHVLRPGRRMPGIRGAREPARALRPRQRPHLLRPRYDGLTTKKKKAERKRRRTRRRRRRRSRATPKRKGGDGSARRSPNSDPDAGPGAPAPVRPQRAGLLGGRRLSADGWVGRATPRSARSGSRRGRGRSRCGGPRCGRRGGRAAFRARCLRPARRSRVPSRSSTARAMWL